MSDMTTYALRAAPYLRAILLFIVAAVLTLVLQCWVGNTTIYRDDLEAKRAEMHVAILKNEPPRGEPWHHIGANGDNTRVLTVYVAELIRRSTALSLRKTYFIIETTSLFLVFIVLFFYCRRWVAEPYCVIGLLYFGCMAVLTYHFHFFHPWDRPWILSWMVLVMLIWDGRLLSLACLLPIAVANKWDIAVLPGLYWLTYVSTTNWRRVTLTTATLMAVSLGTFGLLIAARPGGFDLERTVSQQLALNWLDFIGVKLAYPPLLLFTLPFVLAAFGVSGADRRVKASALFGVLLLVPLVAKTNAVEVRAEMAPFVLMLPAALLGLSRALAARPGELPGAGIARSSQ